MHDNEERVKELTLSVAEMQRLSREESNYRSSAGSGALTMALYTDVIVPFLEDSNRLWHSEHALRLVAVTIGLREPFFAIPPGAAVELTQWRLAQPRQSCKGIQQLATAGESSLQEALQSDELRKTLEDLMVFSTISHRLAVFLGSPNRVDGELGVKSPEKLPLFETFLGNLSADRPGGQNNLCDALNVCFVVNAYESWAPWSLVTNSKSVLHAWRRSVPQQVPTSLVLSAELALFRCGLRNALPSDVRAIDEQLYSIERRLEEYLGFLRTQRRKEETLLLDRELTEISAILRSLVQGLNPLDEAISSAWSLPAKIPLDIDLETLNGRLVAFRDEIFQDISLLLSKLRPALDAVDSLRKIVPGDDTHETNYKELGLDSIA